MRWKIFFKNKIFSFIFVLILFGVYNLRKNNFCVSRADVTTTVNHQQAVDTDKNIKLTNFYIKKKKNYKKKSKQKPWFFKNGTYYPRPSKKLYNNNKLFPDQDPYSDRIINQLMYVPYDYEKIRKSGKLKTILVHFGLHEWKLKKGRDIFLQNKCPVDTCELTENKESVIMADMILYKDYYKPTTINVNEREIVNSKQIKVLYALESPLNMNKETAIDVFNWTATYRRDSDIVTPYEKWLYYNQSVKQMKQTRNYAAKKTKKVAWVVSNCSARNNRLQYAKLLQKYINVDIYGKCGTYNCSKLSNDECFDMLAKEYKFYLSFENSNCKDYITEKLYSRALAKNMLPVVMGPHPDDYKTSAPLHSYIHVDEFNSVKELADYLHILDQDDNLYNSFFQWHGTGELINTYFWCRVCAMLHDEVSLEKPRWYTDINKWWANDSICTKSSWRGLNIPKYEWRPYAPAEVKGTDDDDDDDDENMNDDYIYMNYDDTNIYQQIV